MNEPLKTGAVIGILGGGQLGRMLCSAASRLGLRAHIFDPASAPPAADVAYATTCAAYEDEAALRRFAADVDVITYEFENIPTSALDILEKLCPIRPGREALRISQDRLTEKDFLTGLELKTAPYPDPQAAQGGDETHDALYHVRIRSSNFSRTVDFDSLGERGLVELVQLKPSPSPSPSA